MRAAIPHLEAAIRIDPDFTASRRALAMAREQVGQTRGGK